MGSAAYRLWAAARKHALDEMDVACASADVVRRRAAAQHVVQAYAVILAAQFQGFCRDLHTEGVEVMIRGIDPPTRLFLVQQEFLRGRQLDRGNAQSASLGADYARLGIRFWPELQALDPQTPSYRVAPDELNTWRNAVAHQDFSSFPAGSRLLLGDVRRWRKSCRALARVMNESLRNYLFSMSGVSPW